MGLTTWIAIIVIVLAVVGLGAGVFFSGVVKGAEIIVNSPAVQNVTQEVKEFLREEIAPAATAAVLVIVVVG